MNKRLVVLIGVCVVVFASGCRRPDKPEIKPEYSRPLGSGHRRPSQILPSDTAIKPGVEEILDPVPVMIELGGEPFGEGSLAGRECLGRGMSLNRR